MGVDRAAAVRKADDLAREGKLDLAIEEYLRLIDDQPGDHGAANALGDLYAKVGNKHGAVAQFVRIGDSHRESGFVPKAIAFYKKALKVEPGNDYALSQLAEIAVHQKLYADATLYLNRLLQQRREAADDAAVADCVVRLGSLPTAGADAKMAAARAASGHPPAAQVRLWLEAADALERSGRPRDALDVLFEALTLGGGDDQLSRRIALACVATGQVDRAQPVLSLDTAGEQPDLLLAFAERAIRDGRDGEARTALERVLDVAADRRVEAEALLAPLRATPPAAAPSPEPSVEPAVEPAPEQVEAEEAEAGEEATKTGPPPGLALPPESLPAPPQPLVAASGAVGGDDAPASTVPQLPTETEFEWSELTDFAPDPPAGAGSGDHAIDSEAVEAFAVEASTSDVVEPSGIEPEAAGPTPTETPTIPELEQALETGATDLPPPRPDVQPSCEPAPAPEPLPEMLPEPPAADQMGASAEPETGAVAVHGPDPSTVATLTAAAENPTLQFQASAQLGRLLLEAGRVGEGIAWLERASQASTSVREQRLDVMYELADALERHGDRAGALDVFVDLDLDAASFRDVPARIARLRRALEEGRAP